MVWKRSPFFSPAFSVFCEQRLCLLILRWPDFLSIMVNSEELRKWAGEYRIRQKTPSDEWPLAHQMTFQHITHLCRINLQDYSACASKDSDESWKQYNVNKAAHLSKKSSSLSERSANESAWRHGIEGVIVRTLSEEVAWFVEGRIFASVALPTCLIGTKSTMSPPAMEVGDRVRPRWDCPNHSGQPRA